MAYSAAWDETLPLGSAAATDIDQIFRDEKRNSRERTAGIFGLTLGQWAADPIVAISLALSTFLALGTTPASAGLLRIPNNIDAVVARNFLNTANIVGMKLDGSNVWQLGGGNAVNSAGGFTGNVTGNVTGNASTATALQTARAINGVNFDGTAAITVTAAAGTLTGATLAAGVTASSLTSVGTLGSLAVTGAITGASFTGATAGTHTGAVVGNASTATALQTARAINGVNFDGTAAITVTAAAGTLTGTTLAAGVTASSLTSVGTLLNLTVTNPITGSVTGSSASATGNAATATTLQTARSINGVSFNGSVDITVTAAAGTLSGATLAAGVTASSLTSVGTLGSLTVTGNVNAGTLQVASGATVQKWLTATTTWNPGTVPTLSFALNDATVTGAAVGDLAVVDNVWIGDSLMIVLNAWVAAVNVVRMILTNHTGSGIPTSSRTARIWVIKF